MHETITKFTFPLKANEKDNLTEFLTDFGDIFFKMNQKEKRKFRKYLILSYLQSPWHQEDPTFIFKISAELPYLQLHKDLRRNLSSIHKLIP